MKKILIVDDEHLVRWSVRQYLEAEGFVAVEASSGPEALEILTKDDISVLITDLIMPEMNGVELIRRAKEFDPDLSVLVITADDSSGLVLSATDAGALRTFNKPIPFVELVGALQALP
ncbi:MAG: response regulator [bacterium]|nr:response regulator [bacterium]MDT8396883.1 response regulator [bacterium]